MIALVNFLHLAAAIVWLGGMTVLLWAVRPAMLATLEGPQRLQFLQRMWGRFFHAVLVAVIVLLGTGAHMVSTAHRTLKAAAPGITALPLGWQLMALLGTVMFLVFGHVYFAGFARFKRQVAAGQFPDAGRTASTIHKLVVLNFVLGWLAVAAVKLL